MFGQHNKLYRLFTTTALCGLSFACGTLFFGENTNVAEEMSYGESSWNSEVKQVYESGEVSLPNLPESFQENSGNEENGATSNSSLQFTTENAIDSEINGSYLVVEKDENIVIYFIDDFGAKQFIQRTDIPYGLLSERDQEMFRDGICLNSLTEVFELLQDFES